MTTVTVTVDETVWDAPLAKANTQAQAKVATANANLAPSQQVTFVPLALSDFVQKVLNDKTNQYSADASNAYNRAILAASPATKARIAKVLAAPASVQAAFATQVDALSAAPTPAPATVTPAVTPTSAPAA